MKEDGFHNGLPPKRNRGGVTYTIHGSTKADLPKPAIHGMISVLVWSHTTPTPNDLTGHETSLLPAERGGGSWSSQL